jgi:hypothetical protein
VYHRSRHLVLPGKYRLMVSHSGFVLCKCQCSLSREGLRTWKRGMTRGTYNLMLKRLSLCHLQASVRSFELYRIPDRRVSLRVRNL